MAIRPYSLTVLVDYLSASPLVPSVLLHLQF
jgi:hypothetical protein